MIHSDRWRAWSELGWDNDAVDGNEALIVVVSPLLLVLCCRLSMDELGQVNGVVGIGISTVLCQDSPQA